MDNKDNYFGMDSFNRNVECCYNSVLAQTAPATATKYVSLDGLKYYNDISVSRDIDAERVRFADGRKLTEMMEELMHDWHNTTTIHVPSCWKLKRKDLITLC